MNDYVESKDHPGHYISVADLELVRGFLHTLDLLETILMHFAVNARLARLSLASSEASTQPGSFSWEFWQIDVEWFFASNLLELCYQLSEAWEVLQRFGDKEGTFKILQAYAPKPDDIMLARHKVTHAKPNQFEAHRIAQQYSILRRPYRIVDGEIEKETAELTMRRVGVLIHDAPMKGLAYLRQFRAATIGGATDG